MVIVEAWQAAWCRSPDLEVEMKTTKKALFGVLVVSGLALAGGSVALAQMGPDDAPPFEMADVDGDGVLTEAEFTQAHLARMARVDADGDGSLTPDELRAGFEARLRDGAGRRFADADADGDGTLTLEEMQAAHQARDERSFEDGRHADRFAEADADGDGALTPDELRAAFDARRGARGGVDEQGERGGHGRPDPREMFETADANGDGALDIVEIDELVASRFATLDADGDGVLSPDEARPPHARGRFGGAERSDCRGH